MGNPPRGRLVLNHSTHIPGLIAILDKLTACAGMQTITPGVIGRAKGHCPKLQLKVSVPILGGYKLIARAGKTFQEVFIITHCSQTELEDAIAQLLKR